MKKIIALLLAVILISALAACSCTGSSGSSSGGSSTASSDGGSSSSGSSSGSSASDEKELVLGDLKITVPSDFELSNSSIPEDSDIQYMAMNKAKDIGIVAFSESAGVCASGGINSLDDYIQFQHDNSKGLVVSVIKDNNGQKYFDYTAVNTEDTNNILNFKYYTTAFENGGNYWFLQIYCLQSDYGSHEADFLKWADSVRF